VPPSGPPPSSPASQKVSVRKWRWGVALLARGGPDDRAEAEACLTGARAWLEESGAAGYAGRVAELDARLAG
jgi:hypothetical protein